MNVMKRIEHYIPILIWVYFICEGIRGGVTMPFIDVGGEPPMNSAFKATLIVVPFIFFSLMWPVTQRMNRNRTLTKALVDKVFSEGAYERMGSRMHFQELGVIFFCLVGGIGSAVSYFKDRPEINLFFSFFALSAGLGLLCGIFISGAVNRVLDSV